MQRHRNICISNKQTGIAWYELVYKVKQNEMKQMEMREGDPIEYPIVRYINLNVLVESSTRSKVMDSGSD